MGKHKSLFLLACCCTFFVICASAQQASIVGTWHGTSLCVDRKAFPNCKDEVVIYEVERVAQRQDSVLMRASKIVAGKVEPMGDQGLVRKPGTNIWSGEFKARVHIRLDFTVTDSTMSGTLVDLPGERLVRRISVRRD